MRDFKIVKADFFLVAIETRTKGHKNSILMIIIAYPLYVKRQVDLFMLMAIRWFGINIRNFHVKIGPTMIIISKLRNLRYLKYVFNRYDIYACAVYLCVSEFLL